ncbi:peptidase M23 [Micromonospora sp. NBC_01405]|uniref:peptidase M23 n=1 Tax=Micromonospora sp. NBC_01405 TaxID=2903589 RepID=UPI0032562AD6
MRDDGTLDDQQNPGVAAGRSDVTTSSERPATTSTTTDGTRPEHHRIPSPGGTTTRSGRLRNLLAPGRSASGPAAPGRPSRRPGRTVVALAAGVTCCLGLAALAQARQETRDDTAARAAVAGADLERRAATDAASRSLDRVSATTPSATVSPSAATPSASATTVDPDTTRAPAPRKRPARPADPAPVAGLTKAQMANAKVIVRTGKAMGVPRRGLVIAVATAMQESNLYNVASGVLPESQKYPHQGVGWDHDSVGLFQQRASSGWGEVGQLMDPAFATRQFLAALQQIPGWRDLPLTVAAQAVQISAYPDLYAQHEWRATEVVNAHLAV